MNNKFDQNYLNWKGWSDSPFGHLSKEKKRYFDKEIKRFKLNEEKNLSVLEIGFGNGEFIEYCNQKNWDIYGIEINNILVDEAREAGFKNTFIFDEFFQNNNKKFDCIFAFDVVEHIEMNMLNNIFSILNKSLKNEGLLVIRFPNGDSPFSMPYQNGDLTHVSSIGSGIIKSLAVTNSFEIIYIGPQSIPLRSAKLIKTLHNLIFTLITIILNYLFGMIFFPRERIYFFSKNLVVAFKKSKS